MKLTKIEVYAGPKTFTFPVFGSSPLDKYIVKKAEGLDPPNTTLFIKQLTTNYGLYQGRRPEGRQIVLTFELNPDYSTGETISSLRQELYYMLTLTNANIFPLELRFFYYPGESLDYVYTKGYVKNIAASPFSQSNEVQVTIDCLSPYLHGHAISVPVDGPPNQTGYLLFDKIGTAPADFECVVRRINANSATQCKLRDIPGGFSTSGKIPMLDMRPSDTSPFLQNDTISIKSTVSSREISLTRYGVVTSLLYSLTASSNWFSLPMGPIELELTPAGEYEFVSFSYTPMYWGI